MSLQTFNDGELQSSVRSKINAAILETEELIVKSYDYVATPDQTSGTLTAQTANSISDSTKSWATNQFVGSVVKMLTSGGVEDYGIVLSNTATTLTLDDNHAGYTYATYRVLSTFTAPAINAIYSFDVLTNDCGFVLPAVSTQDNRDFIRAYIEKATGDTYKVAIVCTGADRQRGFKFGFLENKYEGVEFWSHKVTPNHWDILGLENIKRYANIATTANISIASTTFANILTYTSVTSNALRRFDLLNVSSVGWLKYQSITTLNFHVSGSLIVSRSGGGTSNVEITVRVKRFTDGSIVDSAVVAKGQFEGDETKTIPIDIAFELQPYDEVTIIAKRNAGTVTLGAGSSVVFREM